MDLILLNAELLSNKADVLWDATNEFCEEAQGVLQNSPDFFRIDVRVEDSEELSQRLYLHFIIKFFTI